MRLLRLLILDEPGNGLICVGFAICGSSSSG